MKKEQKIKTIQRCLRVPADIDTWLQDIANKNPDNKHNTLATEGIAIWRQAKRMREYRNRMNKQSKAK